MEKINISLKLKHFDDKMRKEYGEIIVGTDECGRGSIAGCITAASVILPPNTIINGLNDSKKLTPQKRELLSIQIKKVALAYDIQCIEPELIDEHGLTWANQQVMLRSAINVTNMINKKIDLYLIDQSPAFELKPHIMLAKGDGTSLSIAAASVIAKVYRDKLMDELSELYPLYELDKSKGYITPEHKLAISKYGLVKSLHRFSYNLK